MKKYYTAFLCVLLLILTGVAFFCCIDTKSERWLNVSQTVELSHCNPYGGGRGAKYHLFRWATPAANPILVKQCQAFNDNPWDSSALILGYTGSSAEATALIEIVASMSREHTADSEKFLTGREAAFLRSVFVGLGLMGRRQIPEAQDFLIRAVCGDAEQLSGLRWYKLNESATLSFAFVGYAVMQPDDLETRLVNAKARLRLKHLTFDWPVSAEGFQNDVDMIARLEKKSVTALERKKFVTVHAPWP